MLIYPGVTLSAATASPPVLIDGNSAVLWGLNVNPANQIKTLGLICTVSPGAAITYSVQVTGDLPAVPIINWNNHDILVNMTTSANGNIEFPVSAVRLIVTSWASGSVTLGMVNQTKPNKSRQAAASPAEPVLRRTRDALSVVVRLSVMGCMSVRLESHGDLCRR